MASKKQKRKNRVVQRANQLAYQAPQKSYAGGSFGYYGAAYGGRVYRADEYSVALSYTFNVAVNRSVEFWQQWLNGLKWEIRDGADDSVLLASDNRRVPNVLGSRFARAIKAHRRYFKHGYFTRLAFSDSLYGESYTHFICNDYGMPDLLEWVNPLAIEPFIMRGAIEYYRYNNAEGYEDLQYHQVAMRIYHIDPQNDLRGMSPVMTIIDELNIEAAEKESLKAWFRNNMQLGGLISPSNPDINMSIGQTQKLEDDMRRDNKGVVNAGRWAIAPANMTATPFPAPDIEKNFQLLKPISDRIQMAMGTYPQLLGDPSAANYDSAYDIKRQWWELLGIPYAHDIEDYINEQILPVLEPNGDCYFAFVLTPYEVEKPEVVSADFDAGFIDMFEAATLRGHKGDKAFQGMYKFNGLPMHKDIILRVGNTVPSQYALDYANAATAGTPSNPNADTALGIIKPIAPALPSGETLIETPEIIPSEITSPYLTNKNKSIDELPTLDALAELAAWRKFVMNGKNAKRTFGRILLQGEIGDAVQSAIETKDKQTILDAFKAAFDKLSVKSSHVSLSDELRLWKTQSLYRFKLGKPQETIGFKSAIIPSLLYEAISGVLDEVKSIDEIYNIFADAEQWESHSHA